MTSDSRRAQPRVQASISVKMRVPGGQTTNTERIGNISLGGIFIYMEDPISFGAEVDLEFSLPVAPRVIHCKGFVVWSTKNEPDKAARMGHGIGVRLMDIGISDMRLLAEYIETALGS